MPPSSGSPSSANRPSRIAELVQRAKRGETAAAELLFSRYRSYLRVICTVQLPELCQKREDVSDIVQQTLLDATRGLQDFRGETEAEFEAWTARLLERNISQSVRRHTAGKRDVRREESLWKVSDSAQLVWHSMGPERISPESWAFRGEAALELAQSLEKLPEDQRTAVELRFLGQQSLASIAEYMSKSTGTVAGLIRRGVDNLREFLPPELGIVRRVG